jgi:hypothetical protein
MAKARNAKAAHGKGWRAWTARLLSVAVLFASLLVPPFVDGGAGRGAAPVAVTMAAAADQNSGALAPSRLDGVLHAGAHCHCQIADRLQPSEYALPAAFGAMVHPIRTAQALASREAEPPARPPRS